MALHEYVPPPKKAIGYAVLAFVVVAVTVGFGLHQKPSNLFAAAKAHVLSLWQSVKAKFTATN